MINPETVKDLKYWKQRKVQVREAIVELVRAYRFASRKEAEQEQRVLRSPEQ